MLAILSAFAQESRLAVYRLLAEPSPDGLTAGSFAARLAISPATLSFHVGALSHAGLITGRQKGRCAWYRADFDGVNGLVAYLAKNCCRNSALCDPACALVAPTSQPARVKLPVDAQVCAAARRAV